MSKYHVGWEARNLSRPSLDRTQDGMPEDRSVKGLVWRRVISRRDVWASVAGGIQSVKAAARRDSTWHGERMGGIR